MKPEGKTFLEEAGAEFDELGTVVSFGNPARERRVALNGTVFADLSHYAILAVHGDDAETFLQGQVVGKTVAAANARPANNVTTFRFMSVLPWLA